MLFATPAQASSGWDYIGTTDFPVSTADYIRTIGNALSTGGDIQACITSGSTRARAYDLWEYDPNNDDEFVGAVDNAGCWIWRDIGKYVDGDNKRAEFYIGTYDNEALWVKWYD
ncbi:hypothetical protein [Streptomyces cavernae]|uniref:hypothetical protein n=1 Tax=Streptomyces cavernae TaxID=2259034 RepID=UPI000FEB895C|nr:hypothetical protein [Streptomyces cavernae]